MATYPPDRSNLDELRAVGRRGQATVEGKDRSIELDGQGDVERVYGPDVLAPLPGRREQRAELVPFVRSASQSGSDVRTASTTADTASTTAAASSSWM